MRNYMTFCLLMMFAGSLVLVSCSGSVRYKRTHQPAEKTEVVVTEKNGPPPHAPAHGYRHKHGKVVLVYHSELDLYVVDGHDGYYFYEGAYFRSHKGKWQKSADMKGPWKKVSDSRIPKGLKPDQHAKAKGKKKH